MRVVSFPQSAFQTSPVAAAERPGAHNRDRAPVQGGAAARENVRADAQDVATTPARTPRQYLQADPAMTGVGLTAQNMHHSENGGPAEHSIVRATQAYSDVDNMRYRRTPFSDRVA